MCLDFGRCAAWRKSRDRTYRGFSTSFRSVPRELCGTWEDAKGCRSDLAKAEGLKLPSPRDVHDSTSATCSAEPSHLYFLIETSRVQEEILATCDSAHTTSRISRRVLGECESSHLHCRPGIVRSICLPGTSQFVASLSGIAQAHFLSFIERHLP